jgi:hypothetical protein
LCFILCLQKYTNSETQAHFPENTASAKFTFEGLQILILGYGWIAKPAERGETVWGK